MLAGHYPHAISLLVHEKIDVIVDQCVNFEVFAPDSIVMIHVSAGAAFTPDDLRTVLRDAGCARCIVNHVSLKSAWGSIIHAHLANIGALGEHLAPGATVSLHASNDLLLKPLPAFASTDGYFELRQISRRTLWHTGRQFAASDQFRALLAALGCTQAYGSQIEGSVYPYSMLYALCEAVSPLKAMVAALPAIAEEVLFPTWAARHLGQPVARPYVLFRPDALTPLGLKLVPPDLRGTAAADVLHRGLNRAVNAFQSPNASAADVSRIIADQPLRLHTWANGGAPMSPQRFLGIKRIARDIDDPLRQRIAAYTRSLRGGHVSKPQSMTSDVA